MLLLSSSHEHVLVQSLRKKSSSHTKRMECISDQAYHDNACKPHNKMIMGPSLPMSFCCLRSYTRVHARTSVFRAHAAACPRACARLACFQALAIVSAIVRAGLQSPVLFAKG